MITSETYVKNATRSEAPITDELKQRLQHQQTIRLLHAGIGMATESGEFLDMLKKHIFYGKPLDLVNLKEEIGDLCWYVAIVCDALGSDMNDILTINIDKLKARFPDKFTEDLAENRDLETERQILEGKDCSNCESVAMCNP